MGMEQAGHKCLGYVEKTSLLENHTKQFITQKESGRHMTLQLLQTTIRLLRGQVDVICGGFPCQAFSIAGKRLGFAETRGTLFFEIARFAKEIKPQYLFLENVKGLLNHDGGTHLEQSSPRLMNWGMMRNSKYLTVKDFESHKIEKGVHCWTS